MFNENGINFDYSPLAIQGCDCIEKYAFPILSIKPKSDSEKRIKYNTMYIMCLCDIVRGNFSDAIIRYAELLEIEDLAEHIWEYTDTNKHKLHLLRAICSLLRILGANELIEEYGTKYQEVVGEIIFSNFSIICDPDIGDSDIISSLEKENDEISGLNFNCDDAIIVPVENIGGGVDWLEDYVNYNIHKISYYNGKIIISGEFQMDIWDSSKTVTTKIEFQIDSAKIESEKKRLKLLL